MNKELPRKFKGKNKKDLIKMYLNLERVLFRQKYEIDYLQAKLEILTFLLNEKPDLFNR